MCMNHKALACFADIEAGDSDDKLWLTHHVAKCASCREVFASMVADARVVHEARARALASTTSDGGERAAWAAAARATPERDVLGGFADLIAACTLADQTFPSWVEHYLEQRLGDHGVL